MNDTFNLRTRGDAYLTLVNRYMLHFLNPSNTATFHRFPGSRENALCHLSYRNMNHDMMKHIALCFRSAIGDDQFFDRVLHDADDFLLALHNTLITKLNRALKYSSRGIQVDICPKLIDTIERVLGNGMTPGVK